MRNGWFVCVLLLVGAVWALWLWTPKVELATPASSSDFPEPLPPTPGVPQERAVQHVASAPPASAKPPPAPIVQQRPVASPDPPPPPPEAHGPTRALKLRFDSESAAGSTQPKELQLTASVKNSDPSPELLHGVTCRRTVCRVSVNWKAERRFPVMKLLTELRRDYDPNLGVDEAGPPNADGERTVDVYIDLTSSRPPLP
jgi:hypothetical protein